MAPNPDNFASPQEYFAQLRAAQIGLDFAGVDAVIELLRTTHARGGTLYTLGNGGSAALASHWACDYAKGTSDLLAEDARFRVVSLVDNMALITAWGNDLAFEQIYAQQLQGVVRAQDAVLAISGSGNSPNVLRALEVAGRAGATRLGLSGFQGGKMKALCEAIVVVPSDNMQIIEDVHVSLCHAMFLMLRRHFGRSPERAATAAAGR